jgi:hypothetical protein
MKKTTILFVALTTIIITSCTSKSTPEGVATDFLNALMAQKWDDAKQLATSESAETIDMIKGFADQTGDTAMVMGFEIIKEQTKIEGDKASIVAKDESGLEMPMNLVKVDGKWKVDYSLKTIMGGMEEEMTDAVETMENMSDSITHAVDEMSETLDSAMHGITK